MKYRTCYYEPSGADIGGYRKPDRIKNSRDIIRCWADAGWEWDSQNRAIDPEFVTVRRSLGLHGKQDDAKLYWRDTTIAEHFETHTVIYANTHPAVNTVIRLVQDVLLNDANFTLAPQPEADKLQDSYLVIAKADNRKAKDADRSREKRAQATIAKERHAARMAHIDELGTEEAIELIFTNAYTEDRETASRAKNAARKRSQRVDTKLTALLGPTEEQLAATAQAEAMQDAEASYYATANKTVCKAKKAVIDATTRKAQDAERKRRQYAQAGIEKERQATKAALDLIFSEDS